MTKERRSHIARVKSLLALVGLNLKNPRRIDTVEPTRSASREY